MAKIKKGQHLSQATQIRKGQHLSPDTEFKKGHQPITGFKKGQVSYNKGKPMHEDIKRKLSIASKGKHRSPSTEFTSERLYKRWEDPEYRKLASERFYKLWQDPEYRQKALRARSAISKKLWENPEYREHQVEIQKSNWQDPEFVKRMMVAFNKKPTIPENYLDAIIRKHFCQYKYNGDGRLGITLGGLTPDFVNINGKKELIELFGDYWHSPKVVGDDWRRSELGKVMVYNSLGWKCLVIWEHELKELTEEQIVDNIQAFFGGKRRSSLRGLTKQN